MLDACGYQVHEQVLCPTQLGVPNRRPRFYLVAAKNGALRDRTEPSLWQVSEPRAWCFTVRQILDPEPAEPLWMPADFREQYRGAVHVVDAEDAQSETHCFTSSYGGSVVRSGSYLATPCGVRRFSPTEILRLLGFPTGYCLPDDLTLRKAWQLVGNSLSVAAVRYVLSAIPELSEPGAGFEQELRL
jgi:site-specific DNA-cytosine methylase